MKKINYFMPVLIVLLTMGFVLSENWYLLESNEYGFKIEFPEKPLEKSQIVNSQIGHLKMNMFILDASAKGTDDNLVYMVNCTEYPDSIINSDKKEKLEDFFRNSINGSVNSYHGKLLSEKIIEIEKFPGREIKVDFKDGLAIIKMRCYLVKNKMYMLITITETKKDFNKSINKFMDSFILKLK